MGFIGNKTFSPGVGSRIRLKTLKPYVKRLRFKAFSAHLPALYAAFLSNVEVNLNFTMLILK